MGVDSRAWGDRDTMEEIEQYQARVFAALDKISQITDESGAADRKGASEDADLRHRDLALIEELEATLAEERLDLDSERDMVANLKGKLVEADRALEDLKALQDDQAGSFQEIENALKKAEADLEAEKNGAQVQLVAREAAEAAAREAERELQQKDKEQERQQNSSSHLEEKVARLNARIENQDVQFQRLKGANAQLRDSNAMLRERNTELLGDAGAVDQSMRAELEALKATRAADVDEMDTILEELKPLLEGQANC